MYLAPGAKISKNIEIGNNCIIGYNTVVTRSIQEEGTYIGMPAKKINSIGYTIDGIRRKI